MTKGVVVSWLLPKHCVVLWLLPKHCVVLWLLPKHCEMLECENACKCNRMSLSAAREKIHYFSFLQISMLRDDSLLCDYLHLFSIIQFISSAGVYFRIFSNDSMFSMHTLFFTFLHILNSSQHVKFYTKEWGCTWSYLKQKQSQLNCGSFGVKLSSHVKCSKNNDTFGVGCHS